MSRETHYVWFERTVTHVEQLRVPVSRNLPPAGAIEGAVDAAAAFVKAAAAIGQPLDWQEKPNTRTVGDAVNVAPAAPTTGY